MIHQLHVEINPFPLVRITLVDKETFEREMRDSKKNDGAMVDSFLCGGSLQRINY